MNTLRGLHFGSYWMGSNDIVFLMAHDLADLCTLHIVDTGLYGKGSSEWVTVDGSRNRARPICWLIHEKVIELVKDTGPDFVIVNSGGMSLLPETVQTLHRAGIVTVGISLSDPDVYPDHGAAYSQLYDLFYTNSLHSLEHQYANRPTNTIRWLPFAASPRLHRPMPEVAKSYDVVIVAHARPDRIKLVRNLKRHFSVGLFGNGWGENIHAVNGEDHVRAVNSGRMYLSFSSTVAGFINVKVGLFEAAACGVCLMTLRFAEIEAFFRPGLEILTYTEENDLIEMIGFYLHNSRVRDWLADNAYQRLLQEHTWTHRWKGVLNDIQRCRLG